LTVFLIN